MKNRKLKISPKATSVSSERREDVERVLARSYHRSQKIKAGKLKAQFEQSSAQYVMRFQDYLKPNKRNKILTKLGLSEIHLASDRKIKSGPSSSQGTC